ncbi:hypothetical protein LLEC1_07520 [Akanthomyces lecanii]|uniref:N-acetyltransferase domain-containing protein n=1 Tax=Cordyceps confragosa TaxID=2714763 RepID=A0A179I3P2_CORDF|nr:hypothetical protein LLEC1_07520 [Akanthomyces lecanii]
MTITDEPWTSTAAEAAHRQLVQLPLPVMDALANNDLKSARALSDDPNISPYIATDECAVVWKRRAAQIRASPDHATWVTRIIVDTQTGAIVGRAGYHGPPDENGMVEVGYSIDPLSRRRGHAQAALKIMLDVAAADARVKVVRASISPSNIASMGMVAKYEFKEVGEQWDDEDGLEKIWEVAV